MAKKYIPAWQKVLLTVLNNAPNPSDGASAWASLVPEEQSAVKRFLSDRAKGDQDKADAMLRETLPLVKPTKELGWLWLIGLLVVCLLGGMVLADLTENVFGGKAQAVLYTIGFGVVLISNFMRAKGDRMRRIWKKRGAGEEAAYAAMKRMFGVSLGTPLIALKSPLTLLALVMLVLSLVMLIRPAPPTAMYVQVSDVLVDAAKGEATLEDALALMEPLDADTADEVIRKAYKNTWNNSDERYLAAALAARMGYEKAAEYAKAAVTDTNYADLNTPVESAEFAALLALCDGETHRIALKTLASTGSREWEALLTALGAEMGKTRDAAAMLSLLDENPMAEGRDVVFLRAALPDMSFADAEALIAGTDAAHQALLLRAIADAFTAPDDVLAFLRLAGEYGLSAVDCYPEGAALDWDTSAFDPLAWNAGQAPSEDATFLFIRRTEKPEPYKTIVITPENDYWEDEFTGTDWMDYDPDAELGAAAYTVTLDTFLMSLLPPERAAQSIADCDVLVITDLYYLCEGAVRFTRTAYRGNTMNTYDGNKWGDTVVDTPLYSALHNVSLYSMADKQLLFSYADKVVEAPYNTQGHELSKAETMAEWNLLEMYLPATDQEWLADASLSLVDTLRRKDWDVNRITIKYLWK